MVTRRAGTQFDPAVVEALGRVLARHEWVTDGAHARRARRGRPVALDHDEPEISDLLADRAATCRARIKGATASVRHRRSGRRRERCCGGSPSTCGGRLVVLAVVRRLAPAFRVGPRASSLTLRGSALVVGRALLRRHRARRDGPADASSPAARPHRCPRPRRWAWPCPRCPSPAAAAWARRRSSPRRRRGHDRGQPGSRVARAPGVSLGGRRRPDHRRVRGARALPQRRLRRPDPASSGRPTWARRSGGWSASSCSLVGGRRHARRARPRGAGARRARPRPPAPRRRRRDAVHPGARHRPGHLGRADRAGRVSPSGSRPCRCSSSRCC